MPAQTALSKYGNDRHQLILNTIIQCYENDNRVLAVLLFGSLGRGNWDQYSDLDLDIIMRDDGPDAGVIDARVELQNLCDFIKNKHRYDAIIIADEEEGDVVLSISNLLEFSIRYHTLETTKSAILDSMVLLHGTLSLDDIRAAGEANRKDYQPELEVLVSQTIRYTLGLHNTIQRERIWMALELLHRIRANFMQLYSITHGGRVRAMQHFEANASVELQERLKQLVADPYLPSLRAVLELIVSIFEHELDSFVNGQYQLTKNQQTILEGIKEKIGSSIGPYEPFTIDTSLPPIKVLQIYNHEFARIHSHLGMFFSLMKYSYGILDNEKDLDKHIETNQILKHQFDFMGNISAEMERYISLINEYLDAHE